MGCVLQCYWGCAAFELRCCCTLSLQVELTDETIQQMVSAGMWKSPKHEDTIEVLEREPQLDMIVDYIRKVQKGEKGGKGVFSLLGTAGMTGIGKTQLLLKRLEACQRDRDRQRCLLHLQRAGQSQRARPAEPRN